MGSYLVNKQRIEMATEQARAFKRKHRGQDLRYMFAQRHHDAEFTAIGETLLGESRSQRVDDHIPAWTAFEFMAESKYFELV